MHNGKQGAMQGTQFADQITIKKKNWVPPRSEHRVQVAQLPPLASSAFALNYLACSVSAVDPRLGSCNATTRQHSLHHAPLNLDR
jgi:hypothetical protein